MDGKQLNFVSETEHVGVVRSTHGNLPHILERFTAHRKSMFAILPLGLARRHRANPAAALRAHQIYCTPVLLSGLSSMILTNKEIKFINQKIKTTLQKLQKLHDRTPPAVVYFLGGHLPGEALLHQRQLTIFGMVSRLPDSAINKIAQ